MLHAQVVVRYKGTHKGKVFDETKGKATFSFRLGALLSDAFCCAACHVVVLGQAVQACRNFGLQGGACGRWRCLACSATLLKAHAVPLRVGAGLLVRKAADVINFPLGASSESTSALFVLRRGRRGDQVSSLPAAACSRITFW